MDWTTEQVEALAPDASALKAARPLANAVKWSELANNEQAVWGLCAGSGKKPYQTRIDLSGPAFKCSCPSRKFPCKHSLALFLMHADTSVDFSQIAEPPDWVQEWLTTREKRAQAKPAKKKSKGESEQTREKRAQRIQSGLDSLELWLQDLIRGGLAVLPRKPNQFWLEPASRLVDAQAPGLATMVRDCTAIPMTGEGWPERLLAQLAKIHLLIQSYRRLDTLPPTLQADVSSLIGIVQSREEVLQNESVTDVWCVLGQTEEETENLVMQRIWLQGINTNRKALLLNYAPQHIAGQLDRSWLVGMKVEADLAFYTSAWPLRALVKEKREAIDADNEPESFPNLLEALKNYQHALTSNPWILRFPMLVANVVPQLQDSGFYLIDQQQN
ncbi:MAG: SWIM zinc finger family protein, partial [Pseudomonadota bacterium]